MSHNINRLRLTIPMSQALTPADIANIITSVEHLALNRQQIRADDIELAILGASVMTSTHDQQQIDSATSTLNQSSAELQAAITKEKRT